MTKKEKTETKTKKKRASAAAKSAPAIKKVSAAHAAKPKTSRKPEPKSAPAVPAAAPAKGAGASTPFDRTRPLSLSEIKDLQKREALQQADARAARVPGPAPKTQAPSPDLKREEGRSLSRPVPPREGASFTPIGGASVLRETKPAAPAGPRPAAALSSHRATAPQGVSPAPSAESRPQPPTPPIISLRSTVSVKDLAVKLAAKPADLIARLIKMGIFANINQSVNFETAAKICAEYGAKPERFEEPEEKKEEAAPKPVSAADRSKLAVRPAIVTLMGHVDHGKTSLLDAIRNTQVAAHEAGGITQHIGAYEVFLEKGAVTFLDTPGHEAFTEMRARGAKVTDIVVLVVAADDGIMPQTEEAIDHARAAEATIVVAINKIDLPSAQIDRVKKELAEHNLLPEDWGGKTICVPVSAKTGKGVSELLEMLVLESELLELRANPGASPQGVVIEAELSKGSGPVATVLIHDGTLRIGDVVVCGEFYGKLRSMTNDRGQRIREAPPSMPVEISGLSGVPRAGQKFYVVENEPKARQIIEEKQLREAGADAGHVTLEEVYSEIRSGHIKALKLVIKSDVQGSIEALRGTLLQIPTQEVQLQIIHTGIGNITKSDVMLAAASEAIVIGFHVDVEPDAEEATRSEKVDVRLYQIIYEVKSAIEKAMSGLLTPETKEVQMGVAEIRQLFKISKVGMVAGSVVTKGKIVRNASCRVLRGGKKIFESKISGLKRFKDDVREVQEGFECGIGVANFKDLMEGDRIEAFEIQSAPRSVG